MQYDLFGPVLPEIEPEPEPARPAKKPAALPPAMAPVARPSPAETQKLTRAETNFADLYHAYAPGISDHPRRASLRSGVRSVARVLKLPPEEIPTDPTKLKPMLDAANPALVGMRPRIWIQNKSLALQAIRERGGDILAGRDDTALNPQWAAMEAKLSDRRLRIGLSKFLRYLSRKDIDPAQVTPAHFEAFKAEIKEGSVHLNARKAGNQGARSWNKAVATVSGWPQVDLSIESDSRRYSAEWQDVPASLRLEIENYITSRSQGDVLAADYAPQVRASTSRGRRNMLRRSISLLSMSGTLKLEDITSLAFLCDVENVRTILRVLRSRRPSGVSTEGDLTIAWMLRTVAKHWVKDERQAALIRGLIHNVTMDMPNRPSGLRPKNRKRLYQFDVRENVDALVELPFKMLKRAASAPNPSHRDCVQVMYGLMVGMLMFVPIRSKNLMQLELGEHLIDIGKGRHRTVRIHLPAHIVKNYRDYEGPLPPHLYPVLDVWLAKYRPAICAGQSTYLFPNARGELRNRDGLSQKLTRFLKKETGLEMHLHLFRHLAAKMCLDHDPNCIEMVSQLLGHTSTRTTLRAYAELKVDPAFQHLEEAVFHINDRPTPGRKTKTWGSP